MFQSDSFLIHAFCNADPFIFPNVKRRRILPGLLVRAVVAYPYFRVFSVLLYLYFPCKKFCFVVFQLFMYFNVRFQGLQLHI